MQPACAVDRGNRRGKPAKEPDQLVIGERTIPPSQHGLEVAAVDPSQDDERAAVSAGIPEANDAGVVEAREKLRLACEALAALAEPDKHRLAGGAVDRREAVRCTALARLQAITFRQQCAGRPHRIRAASSIDRGTGRGHGVAQSLVLVGMV